MVVPNLAQEVVMGVISIQLSSVGGPYGPTKVAQPHLKPSSKKRPYHFMLFKPHYFRSYK